jgi:hypothetical protein
VFKFDFYLLSSSLADSFEAFLWITISVFANATSNTSLSYMILLPMRDEAIKLFLLNNVSSSS